MSTGLLTIDLDAVAANWRALAALAEDAETGAVVKADAYGLGAGPVAKALARAGAKTFFVAVAEEGAAVRKAIGPKGAICVMAGHLPGDTALIDAARLTPMLNTPEQVQRQFEALPGKPFGIQLDTGMNRLGMERGEWGSVAARVLQAKPFLVMSHLACADEPGNPMNAIQLAEFHRMTDGTGVRRSLAATGGILLGDKYHFDVTRPGVGLYGGQPFDEAQVVVTLALPVVQVRDVAEGETVGYANAWTAPRPSRIATVSGGYADGLHRSLSGNLTLWAGDLPCPAVGRVSMDLITVDVTDLQTVPDTLEILGPQQGVDALATAAGTIGYEVLTALGPRYARSYLGAQG
jgi:alanine racemase